MGPDERVGENYWRWKVISTLCRKEEFCHEGEDEYQYGRGRVIASLVEYYDC